MIYLDNAATSWPKPPQVARAMAGVLNQPFGNPGRGGHSASLRSGRTVDACRETLAEYLGAAPERIIFTLNCTDALNMAIRGSLRRGDHVLVTHDAHNAVMRPLAGLEQRGEITLSVLRAGPDGIIPPEAIDEAVQPATSLCVLTHASNVTGTLQDARALTAAAHRFGLPVLLDAAQTAGIEDLRGIGADMIAMPGHKGLLGPMGTGVLCLGEHVELRPLREGGTGSASESVHQPEMLPDRLESGTLQLPVLAGLLQGVRFARANGSAIREYENYLINLLRKRLAALPGVTVYGSADAPHVGVLSFNLPGMECAEAADRLDALGFCLRGGLHCAPCMHRWLGTQGTVRASVGPYSTEAEINALADAVAKILKERES